MNQKRSCPGTPNRYSISCSLIVIRPKSRATVVVFLSGRPARLSRPTLAALSGSSVSSGRTSLIALTSVVLPAPNPPAMRILCADRDPPAGGSEGAEAIDYLLEHVAVGALPGRPLPDHAHAPGHDQVAEQHPDHADGQLHAGRDVGDRGLPGAQGQDAAVLGGAVVVVFVHAADGHDQGDQVKFLAVGGLGPPAGHRV